MQCLRCQHENPTSQKFCGECGTPLQRLEASAKPAPSYTDVQRSLTEALEQQTATSEILRAISSSRTDLQPVFDAVVHSAGRLCDAAFGALQLFDGERLTLDAHYGITPGDVAMLREQVFPMQPDRSSSIGRAVMSRTVVHIPDIRTDPEFHVSALQTREGYRTVLSVPMLRGDAVVGVINLWRRDVRPFTDRQIELVKTFADQAVIAIENVRLFNETKEALEQQTATSEILQVISASPTDLQPVFETILRSATQLCAGFYSLLFLCNGEQLDLAATHNVPPEGLEALRRRYPLSIASDEAGVTARAVRERRLQHVADIQSEPTAPAAARRTSQAVGQRAAVAVPLLRKGEAAGVLTVSRQEARAFSEKELTLLQTFADQAVIAIENVRLFKELESRNRDLTEALEQQTVTAEVLKVISRSTFDLQPVLDTLIENAARLCNARRGVIVRRDGDVYRGVAFYNASPDLVEFIKRHPVTPGRHTITARVALERRTIHVVDLQADPEYTYALRDVDPIRTELGVPMLRGDDILGVIILYKLEVQPFTDKQIALLQTFADQAVIAIENVRLFTELQARNRDLTEALEQQTATSEILRVISSSPTAVQPVFESLVASAARLCGANDLLLLIREADVLRPAAGVGSFWESLAEEFRVPLVRGTVAARSVIDGATLHFADLATMPEAEFPVGRDLQRRFGHHTVLAVPLMREGVALGTIFAMRFEVRPFAGQQVALLTTFADQAVIAIENVRLFKELEARNRDLTESLKRETATGEVLRVISSSPTDIHPVLVAILDSGRRLCDAAFGAIFRFEDGVFVNAVSTTVTSEFGAWLRNTPIQPGPGTPLRRIGMERRSVQVADILSDPEFAPPDEYRREGMRTALAVPMLKDGVLLGALTFHRRIVKPFTDQEIGLLETFAAQAVIAIENVRLFTELQEKNQALTEAHAQVTEALEQQTATGEILRVISGSPTDVQPVFDTILDSATRLCAAENGILFQYDDGAFHTVACLGLSPKAETAFRAQPARPGPHSGLGRMLAEKRPVQVADVTDDIAYRQGDPLRAITVTLLGARTAMWLPLLKSDAVVGALSIYRRDVRPFTAKQIDLVGTFADQAVIAIENVRLFTELQEKNRALAQAHAQVTEALEQQTATSEILRVISSSPTDIQPVFDSIVRSAARLCHAPVAGAFLTEGRMVHHLANYGTSPEALAVTRSWYPRPVGMDSTPGMAILTRSVVQVPDIEDPSALELVRQIGRGLGFRSSVGVPMLREGEAVGAIIVNRREPGRFSDAEVELLKTFADQAVIAVENVRLFKELEARTADLTRSVEQLTALGEVGRAVSSTLDLGMVLTTIVSRAVQLSGLDGGVVFEYDENTEEFVQRVATETGAALAEARRTTRIRKGEGVLGQTAITLEPVQVPDITVPGAYAGRLRETLIESGVRAILAVPMVREGQLIGCLGVTRNRPGDFPADTIELLRTFATQSALAIQNARLFREIEDKSRQLEAASRHKSEFLANMSHELRTPLNAVIGFSEVLIQRMFGALNDKQDEYLKDIYASGQHLLSLINDILDLSKIEAGRMELAPAPFHLPTALENAVTLVRERAGRHGIALRLDIDSQLGELVGDERKIKQVLLNLLSNAVKFTPEGGQISVKAGLRDGAVEIAVTDTGIGIAPEDQAAIFEEFRQVGSDDARKQEGTGLGLTLAKKFVELHGGRVRVESDLGRGSTFSFTLPVS